MSAASPLPEFPRAPGPAAFAEVFIQVQPQMAALDRFLHEQIVAFEPEIRTMADYCIDTSGKRIRPALVFLSGWRGAGSIAPELVRAAAVVELVHLATLVHDDIMDEADVRRSRRTAARVYGASAAVLIGDALFAHALHLAAQFPTTEVCLAVSESTRRVCAGETVQTLRRGAADVARADYDRIIDLKTAELFRVSCQLGSRLAGYEAGFVAAAATFGRHLGIAYQLYDDLADFFGQEQRIGKTLGTDLASGKITLPLFVLLDCLPAAERAELVAEIRGELPPQLALHLRQMHDHGVFPTVAAAIETELARAAAALSSWSSQPSAPLLLQLCEGLRGQIRSLQPSAAAI